MKRFLLTTALAMAPAIALAAPITGVISFDGNNSYNSSSVTFTGEQNVGSSSGTLASLGTCTNCTTIKNLTWSPYAGSLADFIQVTNNAVTLMIDLGAMTSTPVFNPGVDLDLTFNAVLHETGFDTTAGLLQFSTQGPGAPVEVSFSATAEALATPTPEPASLALLGVGLLGLGMVATRRRVG